MKQLTVSAVSPRLIAELLTPDRAAQEDIYRHAGLDPHLIDNVDARVACQDFRRFVAVVTERSPDPHFGLGAAGSFFPGVLDVVSFTVLASATLAQAVETLVKYAPILDESTEVTMRRDAAVVWLTARNRLAPAQPAAIDTALAVTLRILRLLGAGRPVNLHAARLSYPRPPETERHAAVLGCTDIAFGQAEDAIAFRIADLERPVPRPSAVVSLFLRELADSELEFLKRASLVSIRVREVIARGNDGVPSTLASAAAALHMSPRSLQRALEREGVSFRELVDDTQRQQAHLRLRHSTRSIKDVAFELGFRELRSFHRACIRWFGMSPASYRGHERAVRPERADA